MDLEAIDYQISQLALRGVKGTTGTQASFMELFSGDSAKDQGRRGRRLRQMGFTKVSCRSAARRQPQEWTTTRPVRRGGVWASLP